MLGIVGRGRTASLYRRRACVLVRRGDWKASGLRMSSGSRSEEDHDASEEDDDDEDERLESSEDAGGMFSGARGPAVLRRMIRRGAVVGAVYNDKARPLGPWNFVGDRWIDESSANDMFDIAGMGYGRRLSYTS